MPKHHFYSRISAEVLVGGSKLQEFKDEDHDPMSPPASIDNDVAEHYHTRTTSNYICSTSATQFSIQLSVDKQFVVEHPKLNFEIYVDGKPVAHRSVERPSFNRNNKCRKNWKAKVDTLQFWEKGAAKTHGKPLVFSEIDITSDTASTAKIKRLCAQMEKLGQIEIKAFWGTYGKKGGASPANVEDFKGFEEPVPEAANKGIDPKSHNTTLGETERERRVSVVKESKKIQGEDYPLVVFRFIYRSQETLYQMGVIPRPLSYSAELNHILSQATTPGANTSSRAGSTSSCSSAPQSSFDISEQSNDDLMRLIKALPPSSALAQKCAACLEERVMGVKREHAAIKREDIERSNNRIEFELLSDDEGGEGELKEKKREREVEDITQDPPAKRARIEIIDCTGDDDDYYYDEEDSLFVQ